MALYSGLIALHSPLHRLDRSILFVAVFAFFISTAILRWLVTRILLIVDDRHWVNTAPGRAHVTFIHPRYAFGGLAVLCPSIWMLPSEPSRGLLIVEGVLSYGIAWTAIYVSWYHYASLPSDRWPSGWPLRTAFAWYRLGTWVIVDHAVFALMQTALLVSALS